ncbi:MAG: penicillin-binding protein [Gracilibacter sp. BRH_c7a]|nr:MAG: penicillin-binding protein [Gracilibacter sp. BRH_c7a]
MESMNRKESQKRLTGLGIAVIIIFLILGFNLWRLQIANASHYAELAASNVLKTVSTPAVRGPIVDTNQVVMAQSVPKFALVLDWADLQRVNKDLIDVVTNLAGYIKPYWHYPNQSIELITEDILVMVQNQQRNNYDPVTILVDIAPELQAIIAEHSNELPGVSIEAIAVREYPQKTVLGQVLGYVREVSGTELEQFNQQAEDTDDPYRYEPGDLVGKDGIEKSYDKWLRGDHGLERIGIDSNARPIDKEVIQDAQPGNTVQLTVDSELQIVVENTLDEVIRNIQKTEPLAQAGAAVVIEVNTGKILAMASRPFMDPNELIGIISDETAERYFRTEDAASFNRALSGVYPPGSTFKMITGMSALEAGVVTTNDYFNDSMSSLGPYEVQRQGIAEWGGNHFGMVNLYRGLAKSSNIYFQIVGRRVFEKEPELIKKIANEFGLAVPSGIDIPGEGVGVAPSPDWKRDYFKPYWDKLREDSLKEIEDKYEKLLADVTDESKRTGILREKNREISNVELDYKQKVDFYVNWRLFDSFNNSIGQGYNSYTLVQLANAVATMVNGGKLYKPYLVDKIYDTLTGEVIHENVPEVRNEVSVSPETLEIIKKAMSGVTGGEGTANWLFWDVPQFSGGGKTGTAQIGSKNTAKGQFYNGMFVAFAPYDNPQIAYAGVVEFGGHGGETAGRVAKEAFIHYFNWK